MASSEEGDDEARRARERALALLEATHQFPCLYAVTVIAFNQDSVTDAVRRSAERRDVGRDDVAAEEDVVAVAYESRSSQHGKYLSHRFAVPVERATEVLELYARLRSLEGVVTIF